MTTPSEPLSPEQIAKLARESEWEQDPAFKAWLAQQEDFRADATGTP